jgi:hypothetical protein
MLAWAGLAVAQQSVGYASVAGRVTDPFGDAVPGATVSARHVETNAVASAVCDDEGRFRFPYLRPGPHEIVAEHDGFTPAVRRLTLAAGAAFDLPMRLTVAGIEASVSVAADAAVLEAARSQIAGTVSAPEVRMLPMNGRNFLELGLLVPGVAATNIASTQLFPETSAVPGISLSVAGQRNLSNNFSVDGLSANDDAAGLSGMTYGVDAIEEFQVVTSGGQAELGRALGGYINVITRSGTNAFDGGGYGYFRDDAIAARNPLSAAALPMRQWQYGASAGGPIVRDRAFFFANVEQRRLDQSGLVTIGEHAAAAINARLAAVGYPGPGVATGSYANPLRTTNVLAKVDRLAGSSARIGIRYSLYDAAASNARGAGGLTAPSASSDLENLDQALAAHGTFSIGSRTVVESRAQIVASDLAAPPSDPIGPAVSIAGVASFGTLSTSPSGRHNTLYQAVANVSHQSGDHALRTGVDISRNDSRITFPRATRGSYAFASLASFLSGTYNNAGFTQTFGEDEIDQDSTSIGLYVQDEWRAGARLTINAGARYDLQQLETISTDRNNLAPRAGFAWTPFGDLKTIVRASAGLFYDRVPLRALANALLSAGNTTDVSRLSQVNVVFSPGQAGAPSFPAILPSASASGVLPNLTTMDSRLQNASSRQASVEVERQIGAATVSASYQYVKGAGLLMSINQNVPACRAEGGNNGCRPNPAYANDARYSAAGKSSYHGLLVSVMQRPTAWSSYRVSYTLSKAMNDAGEFFFSGPIDPSNPSLDWGRSDNDQRHRLVVLGAARIRGGLQAGVLVQAASEPPFNITSGVTTIQGTAGRPIVNGSFIERNAGKGSAFFSANVRLSQTVAIDGAELELSIEGFNVTNHRNVVARNTNFGSGTFPDRPAPGFGQVTALGDARSFQLGMRVRF